MKLTQLYNDIDIYNFKKAKNNGIWYYYFNRKRKRRKCALFANYNWNEYLHIYRDNTTRDSEKAIKEFEKNVQKLQKYILNDYNYKLA